MKPSPMKELFERLYEEDARIDQVISLAGALAAQDSAPEALAEFLGEDLQTLCACFPDMPNALVQELGGQQENYPFYEWAIDTGHFGFLVNMSTPVMTHHKGGGRTFSWGFYKSSWVYAETFEAAVQKGLAFVAKCRTNEKRKAKS